MKNIIKWLIGLVAVVVIAGIIVGVVLVLRGGSDSDNDEEEEPDFTSDSPSDSPWDFPPDFTFGAASSSYQIEGAWNVDGKTPNIWDTAVHNNPDIIALRGNGDVAADSYHLYKEDVAEMKKIGVDFYRFSISWARILPDGGKTNEAGINYYKNLIKELKDNGIKPLVTIYHWDLPQYIQDIGGWTNPLIVNYFEHYADVLFEHFGNDVKRWLTFNEPQIFCTLGYGAGVFAPNIKSPGYGEYLCGHNVLKAHAKAYHLYYERYEKDQQGKVGICLNSNGFFAGEGVNQNVVDRAYQFFLGWFAHPIFSEEGDYPKIMIDEIKQNSEKEHRPWSRFPEFTSEEKAAIKGSADFLAINYYSSRIITQKKNMPEEYNWEADANIDQLVDHTWPKAKSDFLWSIPKGLYELMVYIKDNYNNPAVYIGENGWSDSGEIEDNARIVYLREHLRALKNAMDDGCNIKSYAVWSILDNFEWLAGYTEHFGIIHVDFNSPNKKRTPKKSSLYFAEVVKTHLIGDPEDSDFPPDFTFGAATASYQIEGAWNVDGKTPNIWDTAVHNNPGMIKENGNGDDAAKSYYLYKEDVAAVKNIGLNFYRFSISWTRILPNGDKVNEAGINYYKNLIKELLDHGIEPMVTMYHWDLPQYIQDLGGWTNPIVVDYFEHYADVLFEHFGEQVTRWITFNEPYIFCHHGYNLGTFAPNIKAPGHGEYLCAHHVIKAHAKVYHNYKQKYERIQRGFVGICLYSEYFYPGEGATSALADQGVNHMLGWFANPIFSETGGYPQIMINNIDTNSRNEGRPWSRFPEFTAEEIEFIKGSADFLALNYYTSRIVTPKANKPAEYDWEADANIDRHVDPSWPKAKSDFLYSVPEGLHDLLVWIKDSYKNPIVYITENGWSDSGELQDDDRIEYLKQHLTSIKNAMEDGCAVKAYTAWSIIDNFEWLAGYTEAFGLYHINFTSPNRERTPKKSSTYMHDVVAQRKIEL